MKLSARNVLSGTVTDIKLGTTTAHVTIDIGGSAITAAITNEAVADMGLKVGGPAKAIFKASSVLIGVD